MLKLVLQVTPAIIIWLTLLYFDVLILYLTIKFNAYFCQLSLYCYNNILELAFEDSA